jgi:putative transposase
LILRRFGLLVRRFPNYLPNQALGLATVRLLGAAIGLDPENWSGGRASFSGTMNPSGGGRAMKRKRYTEEQIAFALRQAEGGTADAEICRKLGISEPTFYRWKKQFAGMGTVEIRRLKQLEEANAKLKRLVADLSLDKPMLQDVLRRKW